jgi:hypothetical protein
MNIRIMKISTKMLTGNVSGIVGTYRVIEDDKEFVLTRMSHIHGRSLGIEGEKGIIYVDSDDNKVHKQIVAPSGACGLNTDDELVEGLSPWALRGVIMADQEDESGEILIAGGESESGHGQPTVTLNGRVLDLMPVHTINGEL